MNERDRILQELMASGSINPSQALIDQGASNPGSMAAVRGALQNAPPQGGMVPTNVHAEPPALATPADARIGVGPAQLGDVQDPLMQQLMQQQPVPGGDPMLSGGGGLDPTRGYVHGGLPGMTQAPLAQAPMPAQGPPQDEELLRMLIAQGGM